MKKILLLTAVFALATAVWTGCKKSDSIVPSKKEQVTNINPPPPVLTYAQVSSDLLADGWVLGTVPASYIPEYLGYSNIYYYTLAGNETYVYEFPDAETLEVAVDDDCPKDWNSGGGDDGNGGTVPSGCYNNGIECKVKHVDNDKIVIVCC